MQRPTRSSSHRTIGGFTIVELVVVIVLLGVLAITALPRFVNLTEDARVAALEGIAGSMRSTISLVQTKARVKGLKPLEINPNAGQIELLIETEAGTSEVMYSNLCPESSAELGDAIDMADYMQLSLSGDMAITVDNRFTRVGFEITTNTTTGCYVEYDSFAVPQCTVTVITADC